MESFAVLWSEPDAAVQVGKLELDPTGLHFEGSDGKHRSRVHHVVYGEIEAVHIGRNVAERLAGKPALVLDLVRGRQLRIGSVNGVGILNELAERLGRQTAARLAV